MNPATLVVHGHFYQPPREDPWTDRVPRQRSARPFHDWNRRVHDECYRAVVAARILDGNGRIEQVFDALSWMSWDAGPTLLRWLEREAPDTYHAFLAADAAALARWGHGGALATPYHHVILPLASRREKVTEVRWGVADFRRRFGREPTGMWLPECAVDTETLEVLSAEGIRFTVVAPQQVRKPPSDGLPGRVTLPNSRDIAVFVYDGPLSHDVAFGELLKDADRWVDRIVRRSKERRVVTIATDGETFGHHHEWGDMALAAMIRKVSERPDVAMGNLASVLAHHPPAEEVELVEPSSWSCSHGVERWRAECGCRLDPGRPTSQAWRGVLRDALSELAAALHTRFAEEGAAFFIDPWAARDGYGVVLDDESAASAFLRTHARLGVSDAAGAARALELLEIERDVLRMDTSCAWFFDDIARLEPLQNLAYAAHALDLLGDGAEELETRLVDRLAQAVSNDSDEGSGATLWERRVRRHGAGASRPGGDDNDDPDVGSWTEASRAITAAVRRAVEDPVEARVDEALALLDASLAADAFEAQSAVARAAVDRPGSGVLRRLAERLGVSVGSPVRT